MRIVIQLSGVMLLSKNSKQNFLTSFNSKQLAADKISNVLSLSMHI